MCDVYIDGVLVIINLEEEIAVLLCDEVDAFIVNHDVINILLEDMN